MFKLKIIVFGEISTKELVAIKKLVLGKYYNFIRKIYPIVTDKNFKINLAVFDEMDDQATSLIQKYASEDSKILFLISAQKSPKYPRKLQKPYYQGVVKRGVYGACTIDKKGCYIAFKKCSVFVSSIIIHELGHAFGLSHCDDKNCVMYFPKGKKVLLPPPNYSSNFCSRHQYQIDVFK